MKKFLVFLLISVFFVGPGPWQVTQAGETKIVDHRNRMVMKADLEKEFVTTVLGTDTEYAKAKSMYGPLFPYMYLYIKNPMDGKWYCQLLAYGMWPVMVVELDESKTSSPMQIAELEGFESEGYMPMVNTTSGEYAFMLFTEDDTLQSHMDLFNAYVWREYYNEQRP
jgi:hypothetical protein